MYERLNNDLEKWKESLMDLRLKYYFLTYLPNFLISELNDAIERRFKDGARAIVRRLKELRLLGEEISDRELDSVPEEDYFKHLDERCCEYMRIRLSAPKTRDVPSTQLLQKQKVVYKFVPSDLDLVKAIVSVFHSAGLQPSANDVLFCNDHTPLTNIETFILRALLFDHHLKQPQQQLERVFIIANVQRLGL